jgi:hypothetical protein
MSTAGSWVFLVVDLMGEVSVPEELSPSLSDSDSTTWGFVMVVVKRRERIV